MAPTEGGLETGGTACLHYKSGRGRFLQFLLVNIEMPHNCCVPFCNATSKKNKSLRFHRFPKKKGLKDRWIAKIRRDEGDYFAVTENTRVCSKHFCEEDYTVSEDGKGKKIVLKKGAVPTIFKWSSEKRSRSTFASKGKRKGKALEAPRTKRRRKSCPHCERKQMAIDRLQNDLEEKNAQLKELSERFEDFKKEKGK
ncbi:THAP domain-containing protein 10-like [Acropora millepora]|uniref:THAP domain-containing protein 10-like n=1 Tax=Acropora millepora TaxID=45264 RepID=UPI001CF46348|nr:THAP domain-containing protein 10-like [Acropora millepora]